MNRRFGGGLAVGDVIQYHKIVAGAVESTVSCGTITTLGTGDNINAVQKSAVTYSCGDTTHCP